MTDQKDSRYIFRPGLRVNQNLLQVPAFAGCLQENPLRLEFLGTATVFFLTVVTAQRYED
jgi:hypothetical protein